MALFIYDCPKSQERVLLKNTKVRDKKFLLLRSAISLPMFPY